MFRWWKNCDAMMTDRMNRKQKDNSVTICSLSQTWNAIGMAAGCNVWWSWVLPRVIGRLLAGEGDVGRFNCLSRVWCYFQCGIQLESAGCGSVVGWVLSCVIGKADKSVLIAHHSQQSTHQVHFQLSCRWRIPWRNWNPGGGHWQSWNMWLAGRMIADCG